MLCYNALQAIREKFKLIDGLIPKIIINITTTEDKCHLLNWMRHNIGNKQCTVLDIMNTNMDHQCFKNSFQILHEGKDIDFSSCDEISYKPWFQLNDSERIIHISEEITPGMIIFLFFKRFNNYACPCTFMEFLDNGKILVIQ